jgi:hypothetical protein
VNGYLVVKRQEDIVICFNAEVLHFPEVISRQLLETQFIQGGFRKRTQDLVNMKQVNIRALTCGLLLDAEELTFSVRLRRNFLKNCCRQ